MASEHPTPQQEEDSDSDQLECLFGKEDDSFREEPISIKFDQYERIHHRNDNPYSDAPSTPQVLQLALVKKHHSLWAEFVYNAARVIADKIDQSTIVCSGKTCLELGAGAGLPGILAALNGATVCVISDYGTEADKSLLRAIEMNIDSITTQVKDINPESVLVSVPYVWGNSIQPLIAPLRQVGERRKFDVLILADLIFNRSEHRKLLWTVRECLEPVEGVAWVSFSHHDPHKKLLDLNFFVLAEEEFGLGVEKVCEEARQAYPFVEGDGKDGDRGMVYLYKLWIP